MFLIYLISAFYFLLIFPLFFKFYIFFDVENKKLAIIGKIFFIKAITGFISFNSGKIKYKLNSDKEKNLTIKNKGVRFSLDLLKDYAFLKKEVLIETGFKENNFFSYLCGAGLNETFFLLNFYKRLNVKNKIYIYEDEKIFKINVKLCVFFNILTLAITLIKILGDKIKNGKQN